MNTKEINNGVWPIRYYFVAAGSLALISILVPLYYIQFAAFVAHKLQARRRTLYQLHEVLLGLSFLAFIAIDVLIYLKKKHNSWAAVWYLYALLLTVISCSVLLSRLAHEKPSLSTFPRTLWRLRPLVLKVFIGASCLAAAFTEIFFELPFFALYYVDMFLTSRMRRVHAKSA